MRLFVALDLPEALRARLLELVAELRPTTDAARWVQIAGLHLTLKFIGEVPEAKQTVIVEALRGLSSPAPIELDFRGLGYFPNVRSPRVLWVGVRGSANLSQLVMDMDTVLEPLGISREHRPYVPHLTLARFHTPKNLGRLQEKVRALAEAEFGRATAHEFQLYQSRLSPRGAQYQVRERFPFTSEPPGSQAHGSR